MPGLSIITVVFNGASTLEKTINSVLSQTYDNIEFLIVDGGSTDGTIEILKRYDDPRLSWTSEPDTGIYDAMNIGVKRASGDWLYFLGADDVLADKDVLTKLFGGDKHDCSLLYGNVYSVQLQRNYDGAFDRQKLLFSNLVQQSVFYRKTVFDRVGLFNLEYKLFADWEFNIRCFFDLEIETEFVNEVIAIYADTGRSTVEKDVHFLRTFLFSKNLKELNIHGNSLLKNIRYYDKWWRLLRSLRLDKGEDDLSHYSKDEKLPVLIQRMYNFQKIIPARIIWIGIFSKAAMVTSYFINRITNGFRS